jgi:hypothetical protein
LGKKAMGSQPAAKRLQRGGSAGARKKLKLFDRYVQAQKKTIKNFMRTLSYAVNIEFDNYPTMIAKLKQDVDISGVASILELYVTDLVEFEKRNQTARSKGDINEELDLSEGTLSARLKGTIDKYRQVASNLVSDKPSDVKDVHKAYKQKVVSVAISDASKNLMKARKSLENKMGTQPIPKLARRLGSLARPSSPAPTPPSPTAPTSPAPAAGSPPMTGGRGGMMSVTEDS